VPHPPRGGSDGLATFCRAAILAADVAGYSKLAAADEERTLARLRALRSDLIDPTIAVHHGRVVERTGDGKFRSVVDAVRCAIEVQNSMVERNAGLPPERRIEFHRDPPRRRRRGERRRPDGRRRQYCCPFGKHRRARDRLPFRASILASRVTA
jgi:class 3 adenylate cyclase